MILIHPTTRADWRAWLAANHDREKEIWLVYNKRHTGEPRVEFGVPRCGPSAPGRRPRLLGITGAPSSARQEEESHVSHS